MRILIVHPVMVFLGGGENLCCATIRTLLSCGHEITVLSEAFDPQKVESHFGYDGLFDKVNLLSYPPNDKAPELGSCSHLIRHLRGQKHALRQIKHLRSRAFDLVLSTQDEGYIPDMNLSVIQWGYFPRSFPNYFPSSLPKTIRSLPLRLHYERKISRIGLVLAISRYSKWHFDKEWKRPSVVVYPSCNMVKPRAKRNLVVTAARAVPGKRLELFWKVARLRPEYEFMMLLTQDPRLVEYSISLSKESPSNGRTIFNASKETYHKFLGEAKVYIHLMEEERFGITIVEAMSASCVPIVHDSGASKEIVDSEAGFLWQKIVDVPRMIDEAMKESPSAAARRRAENFNNERFEKRLSSVFSELQARNPRLTQ